MDLHMRHLTPALERLWLDEVRQLHSLWRRGPPRNPTATPIPNLAPTSSAFKRRDERKKRRPRKKKKQTSNLPDQTQPSGQPNGTTASEIEWPCEPLPDSQEEPAGWPEPKPKPSSKPPLSAEEQARLAAWQVQQNALRACQEFFSKKDSFENDGEEEDDPMEEEDDDDDGEDGVESRAFKFFLTLFEKDEDLRSYYEKNWEKGEFGCLVCCGIGARIWKRYGDCVGLVQHSNAISKTKRKGAHRAFGRAVCRVLGWDITRIPSIVLDMGESLGQSLAKAATPQEDLHTEGAIIQHEELPKEVPEPVGADNGDLMKLLDMSKETLTEYGNVDRKENLNTEVE